MVCQGLCRTIDAMGCRTITGIHHKLNKSTPVITSRDRLSAQLLFPTARCNNNQYIFPLSQASELGGFHLNALCEFKDSLDCNLAACKHGQEIFTYPRTAP
jgi:hypothetical protein